MMKWLLVLVTAGKIFAQCGVQPTPAFFDGTNGSTQLSAAQGTYTISVDTGGQPSCVWGVATNVSWITLSQKSGTGSTSFTFTVPDNLSIIARGGVIALSGNVVIPVVQQGNACPVTLSATSATATVGGGSASFSTQTACQWNAFSNQSWILLPSPTNGTGGGTVSYTVAPNSCVAGRTGSITVEAGTLTRNDKADILTPFSITQDGSPNNLTFSPSALTVAAAGGPGRVNVITGTGCSWTGYTDSLNWIQIVNGASGSGSSGISYNILANPGGERTGHIIVGSQTFTITQQAAAAPVPQVTAIANAASYASGAIAPGEVFALGGTLLGPTKAVGLQLTSDGKGITNNLAGVQVMFDGKYAAPLTYVSATYINAIAPYEIDGQTSTQITVQYQGGTSLPFQAQVQPAAPGIFTLDHNGLGNGAILNQDYSANTRSNPARRGSAVMIFCTGGGAINPPTGNGLIATTLSSVVNQPVTVTIDGIPVQGQEQVPYAGGAPGAVTGLTQINAIVPPNARTGANISLAVQIGAWQSQSGVTIAVQ
jgi:uncharacterized protein (TIGR03437 family)